MKRKWNIDTLIIALGIIAAVYVYKRVSEDDINHPKYHAALYYAHIKAIDNQTSEPLSIEIK